ncbi:galactose-1-phosphate uridylyltransferase [Abditibacteriota bacterium]|nr:galactose-1-phosphate uridylyltransferase [Abditibacteriota bacterium]
MPELRKDPILDRWVIIATERSRRPNDFGSQNAASAPTASVFSPGNESKTPAEVFQIGRDASAPKDTSGWRVRVVPNKFPALSTEGDLDSRASGMFDLMNGVGAHEVVIEHPDAAWDMSEATPEQMGDVLDAYIARNRTLSDDTRFRYILTFRNFGTAAGASINHPHSQIIALPVVPRQLKDQLEVAKTHFNEKLRSIYADLLRQELADGSRIVENNEHFVVLCPYASRFPFETQIYPKNGGADFSRMSAEEHAALAEVLPRTLRRIKNALGHPPYNMVFQTAPITKERIGNAGQWETLEHDFSWHIDILPRLTQVAGFEWGTGFYINPVSPENAASYLRDSE